MKQLTAVLSAILLGLMGIHAAMANMSVYPMVINLDEKRNENTPIQITSKSENTQYVRVVVKEVIHPATPEEQEREVKSWQGKNIVVSPVKFALPAVANKLVRIIALQPVSHEHVYRIYFEPVAALDSDAPAVTNKINASIGMSLIWGVLVRQQPLIAQPAVEYDRHKQQLHNRGNVRVILQRYSYCKKEMKENACQWIQDQRSVYPGERYTLKNQPKHGALRLVFKLQGEDQEKISVFP